MMFSSHLLQLALLSLHMFAEGHPTTNNIELPTEVVQDTNGEWNKSFVKLHNEAFSQATESIDQMKHFPSSDAPREEITYSNKVEQSINVTDAIEEKSNKTNVTGSFKATEGDLAQIDYKILPDVKLIAEEKKTEDSKSNSHTGDNSELKTTSNNTLKTFTISTNNLVTETISENLQTSFHSTEGEKMTQISQVSELKGGESVSDVKDAFTHDMNDAESESNTFEFPDRATVTFGVPSIDSQEDSLMNNSDIIFNSSIFPESSDHTERSSNTKLDLDIISKAIESDQHLEESSTTHIIEISTEEEPTEYKKVTNVTKANNSTPVISAEFLNNTYPLDSHATTELHNEADIPITSNNENNATLEEGTNDFEKDTLESTDAFKIYNDTFHSLKFETMSETEQGRESNAKDYTTEEAVTNVKISTNEDIYISTESTLNESVKIVNGEDAIDIYKMNKASYPHLVKNEIKTETHQTQPTSEEELSETTISKNESSQWKKFDAILNVFHELNEKMKKAEEKLYLAWQNIKSEVWQKIHSEKDANSEAESEDTKGSTNEAKRLKIEIINETNYANELEDLLKLQKEETEMDTATINDEKQDVDAGHKENVENSGIRENYEENDGENETRNDKNESTEKNDENNYKEMEKQDIKSRNHGKKDDDDDENDDGDKKNKDDGDDDDEHDDDDDKDDDDDDDDNDDEDDDDDENDDDDDEDDKKEKTRKLRNMGKKSMPKI